MTAALALYGAATRLLEPFAPLALMAAKSALIAGEERSLALAEERQAFETLLDSVDKSIGIAAFRSRTKPEFQGK